MCWGIAQIGAILLAILQLFFFGKSNEVLFIDKYISSNKLVHLNDSSIEIIGCRSREDLAFGCY